MVETARLRVIVSEDGARVTLAVDSGVGEAYWSISREMAHLLGQCLVGGIDVAVIIAVGAEAPDLAGKMASTLFWDGYAKGDRVVVTRADNPRFVGKHGVVTMARPAEGYYMVSVDGQLGADQVEVHTDDLAREPERE